MELEACLLDEERREFLETAHDSRIKRKVPAPKIKEDVKENYD